MASRVNIIIMTIRQAIKDHMRIMVDFANAINATH